MLIYEIIYEKVNCMVEQLKQKRRSKACQLHAGSPSNNFIKPSRFMLFNLEGFEII